MRANKGSKVHAMSMTSKRIVGPVEAPKDEGRSTRPNLWEYGQGVGRDREMVIAGHRIPRPIAVIIISAILVAIAALLFLLGTALIPGL